MVSHPVGYLFTEFTVKDNLLLGSVFFTKNTKRKWFWSTLHNSPTRITASPLPSSPTQKVTCCQLLRLSCYRLLKLSLIVALEIASCRNLHSYICCLLPLIANCLTKGHGGGCFYGLHRTCHAASILLPAEIQPPLPAKIIARCSYYLLSLVTRHSSLGGRSCWLCLGRKRRKKRTRTYFI